MSENAVWASLLREHMERGINSESDMCSLAAVGEELRRRLSLEEAPDKCGVEALAAYDAVLSGLPSRVCPSAREMRLEIQQLLLELRDYAEQPIGLRDFDEGEDLVRGGDELLCIVAAACRAGYLEDSEVLRLGKILRSGVRDLAPKLVNLWDYAEERSSCLGPDERFSGLYDWIEELAELSSYRRALADSVM